MHVLHYCTDDIQNGAAKASYRLHTALRDAGNVSRMIVRNKKSDDEDIVAVPSHGPRTYFRRAQRRWYLAKHNYERLLFSDLEPPIDARYLFLPREDEVDIVCLHGLSNEGPFLTTRRIRAIMDYYRRPVVWTLMDMEAFTGGCHYSFGCEGYTRQCGSCPVLHSTEPNDATRMLWKRKLQYLHGTSLAFVAPTTWLEQRIRASTLFGDHQIENIPLAIDTETFRPFSQAAARDLLHVAQDKKIIFFGAHTLSDERKGMKYLQEAVHLLPSLLSGSSHELRSQDVLLLIAGRERQGLFDGLPFPTRQLGYISDDLRLALAYQAADVFVCPSVEDAGPMMIPEALLCGTPVVAFNSGGAPDLVRTMQTGYLAAYKDAGDLARGMHALLTSEHMPAIRLAAREAAYQAHCPGIVAERHLQLYHGLSEGNKATVARSSAR